MSEAAIRAASYLAEDHNGMRVDYRGMLRQARGGLVREPAHAEMLRQLTDHITEAGERFYAGDVSAVDEFFQLYCVAREARQKLKDAAPPQVAAPVELTDAGWQPIETAPHRSSPMFVVQAINATENPPFSDGRPYTSDPWCVWREADGGFARWPHPFAPTHWCELPAGIPAAATAEVKE